MCFYGYVPIDTREDVGSLRGGDTGGLPLEEQYMFLTTEPSFQPLIMKLKKALQRYRVNGKELNV